VKLLALEGSTLAEMPFATGLPVTDEVIVAGARLVVGAIIDKFETMLDDGEAKLEVGATLIAPDARIDVDLMVEGLEGVTIEIDELLTEAMLEDTMLVGAVPTPPEYSAGPGIT
jgi:hypothetical protein